MVAVADNRDSIIDVKCFNCSTSYVVIVNRYDMIKWLSGELPIQEALSYLSKNERELLLTNTCGKCFDEMFLCLDNEF